MPSFLEGSLAKTLHSAMKTSVAYDVSLVQHTEVADGSGGYTTTTTTLAGKGFVADYSDFVRANAHLPVGARQVFIFQQSILDSSDNPVVPKIHDQVVVRGETLNIHQVKTDPANALWELMAVPL